MILAGHYIYIRVGKHVRQSTCPPHTSLNWAQQWTQMLSQHRSRTHHWCPHLVVWKESHLPSPPLDGTQLLNNSWCVASYLIEISYQLSLQQHLLMLSMLLAREGYSYPISAVAYQCSQPVHWCALVLGVFMGLSRTWISKQPLCYLSWDITRLRTSFHQIRMLSLFLI